MWWCLSWYPARVLWRGLVIVSVSSGLCLSPVEVRHNPGWFWTRGCVTEHFQCLRLFPPSCLDLKCRHLQLSTIDRRGCVVEYRCCSPLFPLVCLILNWRHFRDFVTLASDEICPGFSLSLGRVCKTYRPSLRSVGDHWTDFHILPLSELEGFRSRTFLSKHVRLRDQCWNYYPPFLTQVCCSGCSRVGRHVS